MSSFESGNVQPLNDLEDLRPYSSLTERNRQLDIEVKANLERRITEAKAEILPHPTEYSIAEVESRITKVISSLGYDPSLVTVGLPSSRIVETQNVSL